MKFNLQEIEKINKLFLTMNDNLDVNLTICNYFAYHFDKINKESIEKLANDCKVEKEYAFYCFLMALEDIDVLSSHELRLYHEYYKKAIKCLNVDDYKTNPYFKNIKVENIKYLNWQFKVEQYDPYLGFIYDDFIVDEQNYFKEIPSFGFFTTAFSYLIVYENNKEWMSITPNEINTMKEPIFKAFGNVITFGLGLGYFAYMVSLKENVDTITIVEKEKTVIDMFNTLILPQFKNKDKVIIIQDDCYNFLNSNKLSKYDYAFFDIYHDSSDGLYNYIKIIKYESKFLNVTFSYWIELSILSFLRRLCLIAIKSCYDNKPLDGLNQDNYKLVNSIKDYLFEKEFESYDQIHECLKISSLRKIAKAI